jgi:hypothetical protein
MRPVSPNDRTDILKIRLPASKEIIILRGIQDVQSNLKFTKTMFFL